MQLNLPTSLPEATHIGNCFSMIKDDSYIYYFNNMQPVDFHDADDKAQMHLRVAKFFTMGAATQRQLATAFGVSRSTVQIAVKKFKAQGTEAFNLRRKPRTRTAIDEESAREASRMLSEGVGIRAVARALGVAPSTLHENMQAGAIPSLEIVKKQEDNERESGGVVMDRGERDSRDREAPMGRGATDTEGRVLASHGLIDEVAPVFEEGVSAVAKGGVLAALPALLKEGLLDSVGGLFSLPRGYYGVNSIVLFLALLLLARVRNPESIRYHSPGEWGAILGLDRCPEVKTLRRKIHAIASEESTVRRWQSELALRWVEDDPQSFATLCVDGHVKTYSGRAGNLPKKFVPREKLCLPASVSYWINALGGKPFMCIHKDIDHGMVKAIESDVMVELESLGVLKEGVDITEAKEPVLTLVFDKGWSPALFRRLALRGVACITWHKNFKGEDWPEEEFKKVNVPIWGPVRFREGSVKLAQRSIELKEGFEVRQIRRLLDTGRQVPLVTTHPSMSMEQVAGAMFSRWSQENYFKYMREQFNLDSLAAYAIEELGADTMVVNPVKREKKKLLAKRRSRLGNLRVKLGSKENKAEGNRKKEEEVERIREEVSGLEEEVGNLAREVKSLAEKIPVGEMGEEERLQALGNKERLFLDIIRMVAYRAETRMMGAVIECQGKKPNARKLLQSLFACEADILPDAEEKILKVRFLGFGSDSLRKLLRI